MTVTLWWRWNHREMCIFNWDIFRSTFVKLIYLSFTRYGCTCFIYIGCLECHEAGIGVGNLQSYYIGLKKLAIHQCIIIFNFFADTTSTTSSLNDRGCQQLHMKRFNVILCLLINKEGDQITALKYSPDWFWKEG